MLSQQGPDAWFATANQIALNVAHGVDGDPNPLPAERARLEELAPLVHRHVDALFGVAREPQLEVVNRSGLTSAALVEWRPLLEVLATTPPAISSELLEANPMMAQLASTMGPLFLGFQMGSIAGHFSERAWSLAVLPLPRVTAKSLIEVNNLVAFAEAWSLERDEVYMFALAQEFVAALLLTQPGTGDALRALLADSIREAQETQGDIMTRLQGMMQSGDPSELMANPESLLDGLALPTSSVATDAINAACGTLIAFINAAAMSITEALLGARPLLVEAYRRHRRSDARGEDAASALFGIATQGEHHDRAEKFVIAIRAQHGLGVFDAFLRVDGLVSALELDVPEMWFERVTHSPLA